VKLYGAINVKALIVDLVMFGVMVAAMRVSRGAGFLLFVPLVLSAIVQNKTGKLLLYLVLMMIATIGNGNLMPKGVVFGVSQKALMITIAGMLTIQLAGHKHSPLLTPFLGIIPYVILMALSSLQGWNPIISYLKLLLFVSCYFAFYSVANKAIVDRRIGVSEVRSVGLCMSIVLIFGSVVLIPFPAISQINMLQYEQMLLQGQHVTSLFCGMTFHSQALGPIVSTIFVFILCDVLFSLRKANVFYLALLLCCPFLIYKTSSRTAMGTLLAGAFFVLYHFIKTRHIGSRWKGKVVSFALLMAIIGACALLFSSSGRTGLARYVLKKDDVETLEGHTTEDVISSRQGLMDEAMINFKKKPMIGNGFQVSEEFIGVNDFRSMLSAPIEKGVWVTAVLEEGGVFGLLLFAGFGIFAIFKLSRMHAYTAASILFTIFVLNLGEFTAFSMSGTGGFYWGLCFIGAVMDAQRLKSEREGMMMERTRARM